MDVRGTLSPGFWYGLSLLLGGSAASGKDSLQLPGSAEVRQIALGSWEDCVRCCGDAQVLKAVLGAAFAAQGGPEKPQLCRLASQLLQRSVEPHAKGTALLELLYPFFQQHPGLLLHAADVLERSALELCCNGSIRTSAEHQALVARQVELLVCLIESPTAAVRHLAERLAGCVGEPSVHAHAPLPGSKLAELLNSPVNSPHAPLPVRLRAAKLLGLCCAASPHVFRQYKASLEQVLQRESSVDVVHVAACGLFDAYFMHLDSFSRQELASMSASVSEGLGCPVPGIQLPAVVGACRILLHHAWEASSAQEVLSKLLAQLVQMLCRVEGQLGTVDWASMQAEEGSPSSSLGTLQSPHAFGPHHLRHMLSAGFAQLATTQPQALLQALCSALCTAADSDVLQVDLATGRISNSSLAIQDVLKLKAQCSCLVRVLRGCGGVSGEEVCEAVSEQLVVASAEGVRAWLL